MNRGIALITGAGSGIGRACAQCLARDGFEVVLAGRRRERLEDTATLCGPETKHHVIRADVTDRNSVAELFTQVRELGHLDLLFNNAGVAAPPVPFEDLTAEEWSRTIETNLFGAFYCAQEAFRTMKSQQPQGGRIINNGSLSAQVPRPHAAPYTTSKHALRGLTKSIALDGRLHNIACGQIDIGNAASLLTDQFVQGVEQADGSVRPEPLMDVEDVARAVSYMASLPLEANVLFMTVMATGMPFIGRG